MADLKVISKLVQDKVIEFFLCSFVDMTGTPKAKLIPAKHFRDMAAGVVAFAGFALGNMGQGPDAPDLIAVPDFDSMTQLPWRKNVTWVASSLQVNGRPWPYCPRTILQRQLERALKMGYVFRIGVEPAFFLLQKKHEGGYEPYDPLDGLAKPRYDLGALSRSLDVMTTLVKYMEELGWDPYAGEHGDANGQFEINWTYSEALRAADRHAFFRWMVKSVAEQKGLLATFMPKPFAHLAGNGAHVNMSLAEPETELNLFLNAGDENGLSQIAYHFIGGLKAHACALAAITAPTVNSYERLARGAARSAAENAPVFISYGGSNRTQMIRIPGPGRIENRAVDGAANPYLAATALLAAGLDGIEKQMPAGIRNDRNLFESAPEAMAAEGVELLPATLDEALNALEQDAVILEALGPPYAQYYLELKRREWKKYQDAPAAGKIETYLEQY